MKRALVLCLAIIVSLIAVTGSIAYFTDSIDTSNVVASGNLHILQHEYERAKDAAGNVTLQEYTQDQTLYPCVMGAATREEVAVGDYKVLMYDATVSNFVDKIVVAENTGKNISYVRTFVAVPAYKNSADESVKWLHLDTNSSDGWVWCDTPIAGQLIDGASYDIYYATNTNQLNPGETTAPSLLGFYLDPKVNHNGTNYIYGDTLLGTSDDMTILVATTASQAIVFEPVLDPTDPSVVVKSAADVAQDATFGAPEDGCHPWAKVVMVADQAALDAAIAAATYDTRIGLKDNTYTLPAQLPAGVRIFAMGLDVKLTAPAALSGYDIEIDGVTFENAVSFSGHGSFEEVTFQAGWTFAPTSGDILVSECAFDAYTQAAGEGQLILSRCTKLDGVTAFAAESSVETE